MTNPQLKMNREIKRRMAAQGVWTEFVRERERLKKEGRSINEAYLEAAAMFPPVDGDTNDYSIDGPPLEVLTKAENPTPEAAPIRTIKPLNPIVGNITNGVSKTHKKKNAPKYRPSDFPSRTATTFDELTWVHQNRGYDLCDLRPKDAPSSGAWWLLLNLKNNDVSVETFLNLWAKLIPSRTQLDAAVVVGDSGKKPMEAIDFLKKRMKASDNGK